MVAKGSMKPDPTDPSTWPNIAPTSPSQMPPTGQGNAIQPGPLPRNAGQFDPSVNVSGWINPEQNQGDAPVYGVAPVAGQAGYYPNPGDPLYDQYVINELLRQGQMNGYAAVGSYTPVQITESKVNADSGQYEQVNTGYYLINVVGPNGEIRQLKLAKINNPDGSGRYGWSLQNITRTIDPQDRKKGHSGQMTIAGKIWGTNEETGAFELVPGAPDVPQGWSGLVQIEEADHSKRWYGVDPKDPGSPPKVVPGMPVVPAPPPGYDKTQWLKDPNGQTLTQWGYNTKTGAYEKVPGSPSQPVETQPISLGPAGTVYRKKPDGTLEVDPNVGQAKEGNERYVPYSGQAGYAKKQRFTNGDWQDAVGDNDYLLPVGPEAKANPPKGTPIQIPAQGAPGKMVTVIANGVGGYDYPPPGTPPQVTKVPGLLEPTDVAAGTGEFLPPRRNPDTGALIPGERNPNWAPTLFADRVRQLQQTAQAKQQELHARIGQNGYTSEQAEADFNTFWDQQIAPAEQQLKSDQQTALVDAQTKRNQELRAQDTQRQQQLTTAQAAGQQAVNNYELQAKRMVGPGFANYAQNLVGAVGSGKMPSLPNMGDFSYMAPDYNQLAQYYTAQALKYISPTAANMTGTEPTLPAAAQGLDLNNMFQRSSFSPNAGNQPSVTINVGAGAGTSGTGATQAAAATPATPAAPAAAIPTPWAPTTSWGGMPSAFGQFQFPTG